MNKADCFHLGYVAKLHGFKGEVSLFLDVTNPNDYASLDAVFIDINDHLTPFFIESFKLKNNGFAAVRFEGVDDESHAKRIVRKNVYLPAQILPELTGVHFYDHEVVGFTVIDKAFGEVGILEQVIDLKVNPLLQVMHGDKEVLIPFIEGLVQKVDREKKELHVAAPCGTDRNLFGVMSIFQFKHFSVLQADSAMKVGTDAMILGAFVEIEGKKNALDVGTGTGVLGLMLAQKNSELAITGIEIDEASAQEATFNFQQSPWSERMNVEHIDFLDFESSLRFDLIVSNPPYFSTTNENEDPRKAQARHVSSLDIAPFLKKLKTILRPDGCVWLIMPAIDYTKWYICAEKSGLRIARKIEIVGKEGNDPIRCVLKMNQSAVLPKRETFCIRKADNSYTEEYIELTKEFHGVAL